MSNDALDLPIGRRPAAWLWTAVRAPVAAPAAVAGLMLAAFVARVLLARHVLAPWEMPDELLYTGSSRSFLSTGHYLFREHSQGVRTIYPALISPAWLADSTHTAYTLVKVINSALMTLGAIPLYLWARRLVSPRWAVLAVVFYLAMPGFVYTAEILTENAFVPATILALFALAAALERPSLLRQLLALGAIALAAATRLQGAVFLLVLPTAIALSLLFDLIAATPGERRSVVRERLERFWPSLAVAAVAVGGYAAYKLGRGGSLSRGLGMYQQISSAHYAFRPALRWVVYHFGELAFSVGLIPVSALVVLFGLACRRATAPSAAERAFLAVTVASVFWVVVQVGTFASHFSLRVEERYMFNLAPALFLALVVWLARGLPRPAALTAAAVLAPAALLLALPYQSLLTEALFNDTYGLIPLWRLTTRLGTNAGDVPIVVGAGALFAGLLFASVPRSWARTAVPVALGAFLVLSSGSVFATVTWLSSAARHAGGLSGDPTWIDNAVGKNKRVEVLDTADIADPHVAWQAQFWNRSVRRVFGVTGQDPSIPDISAPLDRLGRITPALAVGSPDLRPRFVVAARGVDVVGKRLAAGGQLVLWRTAGPLRLKSLVSGVTLDGWTGASASYARYVSVPDVKHVAVRVARTGLAGLPAAQVQATVGPTASNVVWERRAITVPGGGTAELQLPVRRAPFRILLTVSPTFSPAQFGFADTRSLGVRVSFSVS